MRGTASFDVFCVKIGARVLAVAFLKNQKKIAESLWGAKSRMRRTETPKPIWIKFCMVADIPDVVTYTNFGDHRLRGFWVAGGQISPSPIDFHRRPYNTLALPCVRVIAATALRERRLDAVHRGMTKYRKGPTKEHYTGPLRIGNHEKTARLATILWNFFQSILCMFL